MKKHIKVYIDHMKSLGVDPQDLVCEVCGVGGGPGLNLDINHINARGMGGSNKEENISNLMAMCREGHLKFGDISSLKEPLMIIHDYYLKNRVSLFNDPCSELEKQDLDELILNT